MKQLRLRPAGWRLLLEPVAPPADSPTLLGLYRCRTCRSYWRLWSAYRYAGMSWSLASSSCGKCCDNVEMDVERVACSTCGSRDVKVDLTADGDQVYCWSCCMPTEVR